jgi:YVTN family beta-propeller protein
LAHETTGCSERTERAATTKGRLGDIVRITFAAGRIRSSVRLGLLTAVTALVAGAAPPTWAFVTFETGQVRPLALSPDGLRLFACNTPDNALEIFDVTGSGLTHVATVPVGLEPLSVAARSNSEVWVLNHLSDSVSIVDVTSSATARVVRTLLVGDEPRDIVFANGRAFITTAHRGQNTPLHAAIETELVTEGIGRADVWVFEVASLGASLGGTPENIINMFGDTPRALEVSPDQSTVYAAVFHSGNQTTTLSEGVIPNGCEVAGGLPEPCTDHLDIEQPEVGLIVRLNGTKWEDELGRDWTSLVRFSLPDEDVFVIDATTDPPSHVPGPSTVYAHVGTILFNMAVNPVSGKVYVSNTEAFNEVRFEGPGTYANGFKPPGEPDTVRGHLAESRISVLDGGAVTPIHLNKHIDYDDCCDPLPNTVNDNSLAFPLEMAVSSNGATLYVSAFGSSKIGIFDTAQLENDTFVPSASNHIQLSGGGPTGLVIDEPNDRLYVLTRFDNSVSIVNTISGMESGHVALHNPEPARVVNGRRFLYDARFTSSHGDQACASCHIFGDFDSLAWDLGNPDDTTLNNPGPILAPFNNEGFFGTPDFRALKGPMTTQSLRGMDNHGAMHWRGDRTGGNDDANVQPNRGAFSEDAAFKKFNPAFEGLIGRSELLTDEEMDAFTDFILEVMYPPNPIRNLDSSMTVQQLAGRNKFFSAQVSDTLFNCDGCHVTDPGGNSQFSSVARPGFFGSRGEYTFENEPQFLKVPHLRNMYQKVGMFGMPSIAFVNPGDNAHKGDQVRGFGFLHDGSFDSLFRFHNATVFNSNVSNPGGFPTGVPGDPQRREMEAFMHAFPSNHEPIVGQQITRNASNGAVVDGRIDLLLDRFDNPDNLDDPDDLTAPECEVVAKGMIGGERRGYIYLSSEGVIADAALRALTASAGQELTFTATPIGEGFRIGVDRDGDGFRDGDEADAGSDPGNELSLPCTSTTAFGSKDKASIKDAKGQLSLTTAIVLGAYDGETVQVIVEDSGGVIFDSGLLGEAFEEKNGTFKFKSKTGAITKAQIKADPKVVGGFKVKLKTKSAWAPGLANETETTTNVTLNIGGTCESGNATKVD